MVKVKVTCIEEHDLIGFLTFNKIGHDYANHKYCTGIISSTIHQTRIKSLTPIIEAIITSKKR